MNLCSSCEHCREIRTPKGSTFLMCQYSRSDARYPKYPRLPVHSCRAFTVKLAAAPQR